MKDVDESLFLHYLFLLLKEGVDGWSTDPFGY